MRYLARVAVSFIVVLAAVPLVLCVGLFVLAAYARRGERRADPPGIRTLARFEADGRYTTPEERAREEQVGSSVRGEGLLRALSEELARAGLGVENLGPDDYGFGVTVRLRGNQAYLRLGLSADGESDDEGWLLMVLDPRSGAPGAPEFLPYVDRALRKLDGVSNVRWYRRERDPAHEDSTPAATLIEP